MGGVTRAVLLPVIARTLSADEYGVLALLLAATNLLHLLFELGLVTALIKFHAEAVEDPERRRLRTLVFLFLPSIDIVLAAPFLLGRDLLSRTLLGTGDHAGLVVIAVGAAFAGAQFQLFLGHLRAADRSRDFAVAMAAKGAVSLVVTLALVFGLRLGVAGFLLGSLSGPAVVAALAIPRFLRRTRADLAGHLEGGWVRFRGLLEFGVPLVPAALGFWALTHLDVWLLRVLSGLSSVGVYGFGSEICLPIGLLMTSIQLAWPSFAFSRARRAGGGEEIARVFRHLFVILVGGALLVAVLRHEILSIVASPAYAASARVIPPLALATCVYAAAHIFGTGLQVAGNTRRLPLFVTAAVVVNGGLNLWAIPRWEEMGAAWATVATNVLLAGLMLRESNRQFPLPFEVMKLARVLLTGVVVFAACDGTSSLPASVALTLRVALVLAFPLVLVPARCLSATEVRRLPGALREVLSGKTS